MSEPLYKITNEGYRECVEMIRQTRGDHKVRPATPEEIVDAAMPLITGEQLLAEVKRRLMIAENGEIIKGWPLIRIGDLTPNDLKGE